MPRCFRELRRRLWMKVCLLCLSSRVGVSPRGICSCSSFDRGTLESVYRCAVLAEVRVQLDLAEGVLVVHQVLLQDGVERLRLLRAEIDSLKISHVDMRFVLLLERS